ncbi:MAG: phosphatidylserine decarboxylase [Lentisphaeria bacterium]|nr:phosphatidylserine decarboxylase [Lentisphaeria bacterium]
MSEKIQLYDRKSKSVITETVMGNGALRFAYNTLLGNCLSGLLFNTSGLSRLLGKYYDSKFSRKDIKKLASIPGCLAEEAEFAPDHYQSFNDFFTRRLKTGARPFSAEPQVMCSPADGRLLVYENLTPNSAVPVKGAKRTLSDLCCQLALPETLAVAVVRLAPVDYHRFHFPCDCVQNELPMVVNGKYHSVNPIAFKRYPDVYTENTRQITELESELFGKLIYIEVGAFGVGSIIRTSNAGSHLKMDEKGYFKFGGSTVILIFDNSKVKFDTDLLENSEKGYETIIRCGEQIATRS